MYVATLVSVASSFAGEETEREMGLVDAARREFGSLTWAEEAFFTGLEIGKGVSFLTGAPEEDDSNKAGDCIAQRVIRAPCIAWLCRNKHISDLVPRNGISIAGASIQEDLDLSFLNIPFPLAFRKCIFLGEIQLMHATVPAFSLRATRCRAIRASRIRIGDLLIREKCETTDTVDLSGATIEGQVSLVDSHFALARGGIAVDAGDISVRGSMLLEDSVIDGGSINLLNAHIVGTLQCSGMRIIHARDVAVRAWYAKVDGNVFIKGVKCNAKIQFPRAEIGGVFNLSGSEVNDVNGVSVDLRAAHVGKDLFMTEGLVVTGRVDVAYATIGGSLWCDGAKLTDSNGLALDASGVVVGRVVSLRDGFQANGQVLLQEAVIGMDLLCDGGKFTTTRENVAALKANAIDVKGDVFLRNGFSAIGAVRMAQATIGRNVDCTGGEFSNTVQKALVLENTRVKGDVHFTNGFKAVGTVSLIEAEISGNLFCHDATFVNDNGVALSAEGLKVHCSVSMNGNFSSSGEIELKGATIDGHMSCSGFFNCPSGRALDIQAIDVGRSIFLKDGFRANGEVCLQGAKVGMDVECDGATLTSSRQNAVAFQANGMYVRGRVLLRNGFRATGTVSMFQATIGQYLDCNDGEFTNAGDIALLLQNAKIGGHVKLTNGYRAAGTVCLVQAEIRGDCICTGGTFGGGTSEDHNNVAIQGRGLVVHGNALFDGGFHATGIVALERSTIEGIFHWANVKSPSDVELLLTYAHIGVISDEPKSWPDRGKLVLEGLTYDQIAALDGESLDSRLEWLSRQPSSVHWCRSYEQLAKSLRASGYEDEAKVVLIERGRDRARHIKGIPDLIWYRVFGPMIGFGYEPMKVFLYGLFGMPILTSILFWIVLGWFLFRWGYKHGMIIPTGDQAARPTTKKKERACSEHSHVAFNAMIYSVEEFVPLVNLHMASHWSPKRGLLRGYLWIHILFGWLQTMFLMAGLTGLAKT